MYGAGLSLDLNLPLAYHIHVVVGFFGVDHFGVFGEIDVLDFESETAIGRLQRRQETRREDLRVDPTSQALPVVRLQIASVERIVGMNQCMYVSQCPHDVNTSRGSALIKIRAWNHIIHNNLA